MKYGVLFSALMIISLDVTIQACQEPCKAFCGNASLMDRVSFALNGYGTALEDIAIPKVGKLGSFLPVALVAFSLKNFPRQTLAFLGLGVMYGLYSSAFVRNLLYAYGIVSEPATRNGNHSVIHVDPFDDTLFIFDGENELDALEEEEVEDELLASTSSDKHHPQPNKVVKQPLRFL